MSKFGIKTRTWAPPARVGRATKWTKKRSARSLQRECLVGAVAETGSPGGGAAESAVAGAAESAVVGTASAVSIGRSTGRVSTIGGVSTVSVSVSISGAGGGVGSVGAVVGLALVLDGGPVAVLVSLVLDDLGAAVGKEHAVLALHEVSVAALLVGEVVAGFSVLHFVLELVLGGLLKYHQRLF